MKQNEKVANKFRFLLVTILATLCFFGDGGGGRRRFNLLIAILSL